MLTFADEAVPQGIEEAARSHDLGPLLHVRLLVHPVYPAVVYLVGAKLSAAAFLLLHRLAADGELAGRLEMAVTSAKWALVLFGGFLAVIGILTLPWRGRAFYLWEGGFIYHHYGQTRVYRWEAIEELLMLRHHTGDQTGEIHQYRLVPLRGRPITVPVRLTDGQDPFTDALVEVMHRAGRPVA